MPAEPTPPLGNPGSPTMILASIITRGDMALPGKPNARIIALGVLAGLFHLFSVVHQTRQMGTFASPTVA